MKKTNPVKKNGHDDRESSPGNHRNSHTPKSEGNDSEVGSSSEPYKPKLTLPSHQEPTYFIGGGNGNALLEEIFEDLGWRKIKDKLDDSYTMKWCELKQTINYNTFREGDQLVNHIPNCNLLTNKLGLLNSLQEYCRVCSSMKKRVPKLDFIPETFRLEEARERDALKKAWNDGDVWICKPTGRNQGKGIFLVKNRDEMEQLCRETDDRIRQQQQQTPKIQKPMNRVIQRYLDRPLLLKNKKFDIRAYMLVASTVPYLVLYHKGYIRLSMFEYENKFDNLAMHLTNQFIQKKDPMYKQMKEETIWDMDKLNSYINEHIAEDKGLELDWVHKVLPGRMKHIMSYCFNAVKHRLQCKVGYFDLYGFDFMIDDDMKVWLIEVNVNPTLATNCDTLRTVIPPMVKETLYLAIECFDKSRKCKSLMPVQSQVNFETIYNGDTRVSRTSRASSPPRAQGTRSSVQGSHHRYQSPSPVRRSRSISPSKEGASQHSLESSRKVGVFSLKPGIKPSPTSTLLPISRQNAAMSSHSPHRSSFVANQSSNRIASLQPYQKAAYTAPKPGNSRTFNGDKSAETSVLPKPRHSLSKTLTGTQNEAGGKVSRKLAAVENDKGTQLQGKDLEEEHKTDKAGNSRPKAHMEHGFSKFLQDPVTRGTQSSEKNTPEEQSPNNPTDTITSPSLSKGGTSYQKKSLSKTLGASRQSVGKSSPTRNVTSFKNQSNNNNTEKSSSSEISPKVTRGKKGTTGSTGVVPQKDNRGS